MNLLNGKPAIVNLFTKILSYLFAFQCNAQKFTSFWYLNKKSGIFTLWYLSLRDHGQLKTLLNLIFLDQLWDAYSLFMIKLTLRDNEKLKAFDQLVLISNWEMIKFFMISLRNCRLVKQILYLVVKGPWQTFIKLNFCFPGVFAHDVTDNV